MKFDLKYKLCLQKRYFETGYGITNYVKYFIILFGAYSVMEKISLKLTLIAAVTYAVICYIIGYLWFRGNWQLAEQEVSNQYNLFCRELRKRKI